MPVYLSTAGEALVVADAAPGPGYLPLAAASRPAVIRAYVREIGPDRPPLRAMRHALEAKAAMPPPEPKPRPRKSVKKRGDGNG